jgi:hypothetical protein
MLAVCAICALLIGCATTTERWYKAGVSEYDSDNAYAQCEYDVSMQKLSDKAEQSRTINSCMIRQGYRWTELKAQ